MAAKKYKLTYYNFIFNINKILNEQEERIEALEAKVAALEEA